MDETAVLRRFNRAYTQRIGVLEESFLGTGRALGPSRVLFEIGAGEVSVTGLRTRLGLDSGYLSRLLRQLEQEELVELGPDPSDGRRRLAQLTAKGKRVWRRLETRSEELAQRLIAPLSERQRAELAKALGTAERLLRAATIRFEVVDPASPDAQSALGQYFAELDARFSTGFDPDAGGDADAGLAALSAPQGRFLLASSDGAVVGCGGVQRLDDQTVEIKRMWIHPTWRELGLGRRLLAQLEEMARELGGSRVVLDTNGTLTEAIALYRRLGYQPVERYNDNPYAQHWFAKPLGA